jgi:hypothetical protein
MLRCDSIYSSGMNAYILLLYIWCFHHHATLFTYVTLLALPRAPKWALYISLWVFILPLAVLLKFAVCPRPQFPPTPVKRQTSYRFPKLSLYQASTISINPTHRLNAEAPVFRPTGVSSKSSRARDSVHSVIGNVDQITIDKMLYCAERLLDEQKNKSVKPAIYALQIQTATQGFYILHHLSCIWNDSSELTNDPTVASVNIKATRVQHLLGYLNGLIIEDAMALFNIFNMLTNSHNGLPVWMKDTEERRNLTEMELSLQFWAIEVGIDGLYKEYKHGVGTVPHLMNLDEQWDFGTSAHDAEKMAHDAEKMAYYDFTLQLEGWGMMSFRTSICTWLVVISSGFYLVVFCWIFGDVY